jgi:beta-glucuronidase
MIALRRVYNLFLPIGAAILVGVFAVCFFATSRVLGPQRLQTLLVGVDHRSVTSLNGEWHYLVDQSPARALYTASGEINDKSYALNEHPNIVGRHNQEYDFATAPTLIVPGDWNTQVPQLFNYEGVV